MESINSTAGLLEQSNPINSSRTLLVSATDQFTPNPTAITLLVPLQHVTLSYSPRTTAALSSVTMCSSCFLCCATTDISADDEKYYLLKKYTRYEIGRKVPSQEVYGSSAPHHHGDKAGVKNNKTTTRTGMIWFSELIFYGQTPESGIPPSDRATRWHTKVHLDFFLRFSTLIGQIGLPDLPSMRSSAFISRRVFQFPELKFRI